MKPTAAAQPNTMAPTRNQVSVAWCCRDLRVHRRQRQVRVNHPQHALAGLVHVALPRWSIPDALSMGRMTASTGRPCGSVKRRARSRWFNWASGAAPAWQL